MDVVICGAGVVGLAMANLLAQHTHLQIAVLDPNVPQLNWDESQYDLRCSAIAPSSQQIFNLLNVWQDIFAHRIGSYQKMTVWDQELHNNVTFNATDINLQNLGHIVENRVLIKVLYNKLATYSNVRIIHKAAQNLTQTNTHVQIKLDNEELQCKLLIAADGAKSWVREVINIPSYGWDYQQTALVATIQTEHTHANIAMQRFTQDGTIAFLPLAQPNLCSIVWSSNPSSISQLLSQEAAEFNRNLAQAFDFKLGQVQLCGKRASFPLRMQHATEYVAPRIALLGDAAHVIHPLAGQGLNLGLLDAAAMYTALQSVINQSEDLGSAKALRQYARARRWHNTSMILGLEMLQKMFASQNRGIGLVRNLGMHLCNSSALGKNLIMHFASGLNPDLLKLPIAV